MDKTDKQAVYDIAAKLGYTGNKGPSVASAIYAVAQARGYEGACEGDASQALQALYTVVSGGGGGGDLGSPVEVGIYTSSSNPLEASVHESTGNISFWSDLSSFTVPSGFTYTLGNFEDEDGTSHAITSAADVSATISYDEGQTTEAFTDYEIIENMFGLKEISVTIAAITTPLEVNPLIEFTIAT